MADAQPVSRSELLRAMIAVCAFGGVFLLLWAVSAQEMRLFALAIGAWLVGGVLSVGVDDSEYSDPNEVWDGGGRETATPTESVDDPGTQTSADALERVRERYARGEIAEAEFERRVERLLTADGADDEAVRALRQRYAEGDLSEEQFERKLDRLAETRTLEDATDAYEREGATED